MSRTSSLAAVVLAASLAFVVTACGDDEPAPPVATPVAEAPSQPPTPEAPEPFDATCENIVTQATLDGFTADSVVITPQDDFIAKMTAEGQSKYVTMDEAGGAVCQTGNGYSAYEIYGYAPVTADQGNSIATTLYDEGFEVDTSGGSPGQWFAYPADMEGVDRSWYFDDGIVIVGGSKERVEEILAIVTG